VLVGGDGDEAAVLLLEPVAHELDGLDLRVAVKRDGGTEEEKPYDDRLAGRLARRERPQHIQVALSRRVLCGGAFQLGRVDADVGACELAHLLQLLRRPRRLGGASPADNDDLPQRGRPDRLDRRIRGVGGRELLWRQREHPRDVERDVAVPDYDGALDVQVERQLLVIRVAVVPGDELRGRPRAGQLLARDLEPPVGLGAERVDDGVVQASEVGVRQVSAHLDVAEEPEAGLLGNALERARDALQLRMVGRHA
jgi:hypothetical protein